jgi:hypothetical protein
MSLINNLKPGVNLHGLMEGVVLNRNDPKKEGRVGVFISRVMGLIPNSSEEEDSILIVDKESSKDDDANAVSGTAIVNGVNYLWAKRASRCGKDFGEWIIPRVGTSVFVFFLDGDPTQLYYLPFGPGDRCKRSKDIDDAVIHETPGGSKIGFSFTSVKDVYLDDTFYVELPDGSGIKIDSKNGTIDVMTKSSAAKIEMKKDGAINIIGDKLAISGNEIVLNTPKGAILWKPNIVPNCPLGGFIHGGEPAISDLKGGQKVL